MVASNIFKKITWVVCLLGFFAFPLISLATYSNGGYGSGGYGTAVVTDTTPPVISSVTSGSPTSSSVTITWTTDEASTSQVQYSTNTTFDLFTSTNSSLVTSHTVVVSGLNSNTTYNYRVVSKDASNNTATSSASTFSTTSVADTTAPVISSIAVSNITQTSAVVTWTTNEASSTQVEYGTTIGSYPNSTTFNSSLVTSHTATISGLSANTTYHYRVVSKDGSNNTATSGNNSFDTIPLSDTTAPIISAITSAPNQTTATISWITNEASTSQVRYGITTSYGSTTTLDSSLVTSHSVPLSGLTANTTYHYQVLSKDASNNTTTSTDNSFLTTNSADTTAPVLTNGLPSSTQPPGTTGVNLTINTNEAATCKYSTTANTAYESMTQTFTTTGGTSHTTSVSGLSNGGSYKYYVRCSDSAGNASATDYQINFSISNTISSGGGGGNSGGGGGGSSSNDATPRVDAGASQTVSTSTITLVGSATVSGSTISRYEWKKTSGNGGVIVSPNSATTQVRDLTNGAYYFELAATSAKSITAKDTVKITVKNVIPGTGTIPSGCGTGALFSTITGEKCPVGSANAGSGTTVIPPGCGTGALFSTITGEKCPVGSANAGSGTTVIPPGCGTGALFSTITGEKCPVGGTSSGTVSTPSGTIIIVATNVLNVRQSPITGAVIGKELRGAEGTITLGTLADAWIKVKFNSGLEGYVSRALVIAKVTNTGTGTVSSNQIRVTSSTTLLVRDQIGGAIVGRAQPGSIGTVLERIPSSGGLSWLKVQFSGLTGWISSMYTVPVTGQSQAPVVVTPPPPQTTQPQSTINVSSIVSSIPNSAIVRTTVGGEIAGRVPAGTIGVVLEKVPSSGGLSWLKVQFPIVTGWVSSMVVR